MLTQIYEIFSPDEARGVSEIGIDHVGILVGDGEFPREQPLSRAAEIAAAIVTPARVSTLFLTARVDFIIEWARALKRAIIHLNAAPELLPPDQVASIKAALPDTSTAELMARLKVDDLMAERPSVDDGNVAPIEPADVEMEAPETDDTSETSVAAPQHDDAEDCPASDDVDDDSDERQEQSGHGSGETNGASRPSDGGSGSHGAGLNGGTRPGTRNAPANRKSGERTFVSYVATHPEDDDEDDPDGLSHEERLALEAKAIDFIRAREPLLKPMPAGNKGFDLIETDANDEPERWVEVKAMKGTLDDRPVGISSVQFEFARQHGEQFWLYIVERANDPDRARIVKIKDPVGKAGTFTFDKGWSSVAEIEAFSEDAARDAEETASVQIAS